MASPLNTATESVRRSVYLRAEGLLSFPDFPPQRSSPSFTHEIAHELLHRGDRRKETSHTIRETEAEAVAFVVSTAIGLNPGTSSSDYIQLHSGDQATLVESLALIQQTASVILQAIEPLGDPRHNSQSN
jgi:hypothetical protein